MRRYGIQVLCILYVTSLQAAAPVFHVLCAEWYLSRCKITYTRKQKEAFLRGTLFPDIRYIAAFPRSVTHRKNITLNTIISTENPFTAGLLFHTYVDEQREK